MIPRRDRIRIQAPAKVNLYLRITGRREDGYHYLTTLMQKISLFDLVELERKPEGISLCCGDCDLPENENNLAFRAAVIFLEKKKNDLRGDCTGVAINLRKSIPVAAGLGGGSSDAAAVIRGLDELFATCCSEEEMLEMGSSLGADVPFFISDRPVAWATGIGDLLHQAVPLSGYSILVANPGFSVSTPWVYEKFALTAGEKINNLKILKNLSAEDDRQHVFAKRPIRPEELINDLEPVASKHYREIELLKNRLLECGAAAAMMTGSGPTVYGLFRTSEAERAAVCARELKGECKFAYLADPLQA